MNNEDNQVTNPLLELEWLARLYHRQGFGDKAREILSQVQALRHLERRSNVVVMADWNREEEKEA